MKNILIISRDPSLSFRQTQLGNGVSDDRQFRFFINDFACEPDFVVVKSKALREAHTFNVPRSHTILLTEEPYTVLEYPRGYYSQFGTVVSCQEQIKPYNGGLVHYAQAAVPWFVGVTFGKEGCQFTMDYAAMAAAKPQKEKLISVISSTKSFSSGHVDRIRFIQKLKERYGDSVDIFGHGFRPFDDKWSVLAPYKYHIVIENSASQYYWTEKLADCYLAEAYPLYHGCQTIDEYFPREAYTSIDIRKPEEAFQIIDHTLAANTYDAHTDVLHQAKQLVMDKYNVFNLIAGECRAILAAQPSQPTAPATTTLQPASKYFSLHNWWNYALGRTLCKLRGRQYIVRMNAAKK